MKPGSACPAPTKKEKIDKFDLDRKQKGKGQHKSNFCFFVLHFYTARYKKHFFKKG